MTLQYELENLDGVDENISKLYIEKDGKYVLDVQGHEKPEDKNMIPISRLNQEIEKRKASEKSLKEVADQLVELLKSGTLQALARLSPLLAPLPF